MTCAYKLKLNRVINVQPKKTYTFKLAFYDISKNINGLFLNVNLKDLIFKSTV